jgi:hypothetical protein
MNKYYFIFLLIYILHSCTNNHSAPISNSEIGEHKTDSFFPVTSFIRGQIITLDSLPITPLKITTIKGKIDSVWLPKNELAKIFQPFISPVINETNLTTYFTETKFNDQTLYAVTFTYDQLNVLPDSITLRHWDVYIHPETGKVIKVYIVKELKENSKRYTQQLTWQTDKTAKISTILNNPDGVSELVKEEVIIWDFSNK